MPYVPFMGKDDTCSDYDTCDSVVTTRRRTFTATQITCMTKCASGVQSEVRMWIRRKQKILTVVMGI